MTDFRRTTQSACDVRACLPPPAMLPLPPGPWRQAAAAAATAGGASAAEAVAPAMDSLWGEIPGSVTALYEAAGPEAVAALARLQELVGLDYSRLYPGNPAATATDGTAATATGGTAAAAAAAASDPRSAFPFRAGSGEALRRLRYYVWGSADYDPEAGALALPEGQQQLQQPLASLPSLLYFTNTRWAECGSTGSCTIRAAWSALASSAS